jgi:hypothetical protein
MKKKRSRPKEISLLEKVAICLQEGVYVDTRHAASRQVERQISRLEVLFVLRNGRREPKRDRFDRHSSTWSYAIRGLTIDRRDVRIIVAFEGEILMIITTILL